MASARYTDIFLFDGGRWLFLARQASVVPGIKANQESGERSQKSHC